MKRQYKYILQATSMIALMEPELWHGYKTKKEATRAKHREIHKMKQFHPLYRAWKFKVIKVR